MKFNKVELTEETIIKTRQWFADSDMACIEEVKNGSVRVNDPERYFAWREKAAKESLEGLHDHTVTFL
ncbi:hypothetical protein ACH6EH_06830 [Paenibacillus sp. JSM ZJ436]|uniref:hypothetical protein n=1 Tax=Paenibacillus sp. JSM ZJ436 TaxID=3376190 RepID=UPI0037B75B87